MNKTPTTLIIMDGFGLRTETEGNAVAAANTPRLDQFFQEYAHTELSASGLEWDSGRFEDSKSWFGLLHLGLCHLQLRGYLTIYLIGQVHFIFQSCFFYFYALQSDIFIGIEKNGQFFL